MGREERREGGREGERERGREGYMACFVHRLPRFLLWDAMMNQHSL